MNYASLSLVADVIENNNATGGIGGNPLSSGNLAAGRGGDARGGGLSMNNGSLTESGFLRMESNAAVGGPGGNGGGPGGRGGDAFGGGMYTTAAAIKVPVESGGGW